MHRDAVHRDAPFYLSNRHTPSLGLCLCLCFCSSSNERVAFVVDATLSVNGWGLVTVGDAAVYSPGACVRGRPGALSCIALLTAAPASPSLEMPLDADALGMCWLAREGLTGEALPAFGWGAPQCLTPTHSPGCAAAGPPARRGAASHRGRARGRLERGRAPLLL